MQTHKQPQPKLKITINQTLASSQNKQHSKTHNKHYPYHNKLQ